jgi:hypothetical protein
MRRAVLIAAILVVAAYACRTTQPPGAEEQLPIQQVGQEPIQNVPAEPPGPASPLTAPPVDAGTPG